jgi:hypothetical protein
MSWKAYIDNLMGTQHMTDVGIFGSDGSVWASSERFPVFIRIFFYRRSTSKIGHPIFKRLRLKLINDHQTVLFR